MNKRNADVIDELIDLINDHIELDGSYYDHQDIYGFIYDSDMFRKWLYKLLIRLDIEDLINHVILEEL